MQYLRSVLRGSYAGSVPISCHVDADHRNGRGVGLVVVVRVRSSGDVALLRPSGSRLVDVAAEVSGVGYSYNPAELDVSVTLRVPGGVSRDQVPELLGHILASRGFTTIRTPGSPMLSVVRLDWASGMASTVDTAGAGFVTFVYEANHVPAKSLADAARGMLSRPGGTVAVITGSELVAISDLSARVDEIRTLFQRLDKPDRTEIHEITLQHLTAQQAFASIAQILPKRESVAGQRMSGEVVPGADGRSLR